MSGGPQGALACIVTCEHGGNRIPGALAPVFAEHRAMVASHHGWDPGALGLARILARRLQAPLVAATVSRLVVDLNRSPGHPALFSAVMRAAPRAVREAAFARWYLSYRDRVRARIRDLLAEGATVLHLSIHSFTPVLDGARRAARSDSSTILRGSRSATSASRGRPRSPLASRAGDCDGTIRIAALRTGSSRRCAASTRRIATRASSWK